MARTKFIVELGSSNTVIYKKTYGIILKEPSIIALDTKDHKVLEVGTRAKKMQGKVDETIMLVSPIKNGIVQDEYVAQLMLECFFNRILENKRESFDVTFVTRIGLNDNELLMLKNIGYSVGACEVDFTNVCIAGLKGLGVQVEKSHAVACVNIGGETCNFAVVSLSETIKGFSVSFGGKDMDNAIKEYLRYSKKIEISTNVAEKIKNECGSLYAQDMSNMEVDGIDCDTKRPMSEIIYATEIREAILHYFDKICQGIEQLLYSCTADVIADVAKNGIYITGGVANLTGIENYLYKKINMPIFVADEPENCTIIGGAN